jgi:hypothetical protein
MSKSPGKPKTLYQIELLSGDKGRWCVRRFISKRVDSHGHLQRAPSDPAEIVHTVQNSQLGAEVTSRRQGRKAIVREWMLFWKSTRPWCSGNG